MPATSHARDGVVLLGHVRNAHEGQLILAPDLKETLAAVDQFEIDALKKIDDYISRVGLAAPTENILRLLDGYKEEEVTELNLQGVGISTVVWATGYAFDFSLVKLPVVDSDGYPEAWNHQIPRLVLSGTALVVQPKIGNSVRCRRRCCLSGSTYCRSRLTPPSGLCVNSVSSWTLAVG